MVHVLVTCPRLSQGRPYFCGSELSDDSPLDFGSLEKAASHAKSLQIWGIQCEIVEVM